MESVVFTSRKTYHVTYSDISSLRKPCEMHQNSSVFTNRLY